MSRQGYESEGCEDSNQSVKHSDFCVPMLPSIICSISGGTWLEQTIIGISGQVHLQSGVGQLPEFLSSAFQVWKS